MREGSEKKDLGSKRKIFLFSTRLELKQQKFASLFAKISKFLASTFTAYVPVWYLRGRPTNQCFCFLKHGGGEGLERNMIRPFLLHCACGIPW